MSKKPKPFQARPKTRAQLAFICAYCKRPFATLDANGLSFLSHHGADKHKNNVSIETLETMLGLVKEDGKEG